MRAMRRVCGHDGVPAAQQHDLRHAGLGGAAARVWQGRAPRGLLGAAGGGAGHGRQSSAGCARACDSGDAKEILAGVPAQQLSRVYTLAPETFTDEEMVAMDTYFGNEGYTRYDATLADFTKNDLSTDVILEDKAGFFKLWLTVGQRQPDLYLDALLELDLPFFCIPIGRMRVRPNTLKRACLRAR